MFNFLHDESGSVLLPFAATALTVSLILTLFLSVSGLSFIAFLFGIADLLGLTEYAVRMQGFLSAL